MDEDRTADDTWVVALGPGPATEVRAALSRWRVANPAVGEDDIRIDLIRTSTGDQLRVLGRGLGSTNRHE